MKLRDLMAWLVLLAVVFLASALFYRVVLNHGSEIYRRNHSGPLQVAARLA